MIFSDRTDLFRDSFNNSVFWKTGTAKVWRKNMKSPKMFILMDIRSFFLSLMFFSISTCSEMSTSRASAFIYIAFSDISVTFGEITVETQRGK